MLLGKTVEVDGAVLWRLRACCLQSVFVRRPVRDARVAAVVKERREREREVAGGDKAMG